MTAACAGTDEDPDVLLISIDTLRADHVGLYGYPRDTTPEIDLFFGRGTVFENASASAPCTVPSVRQFLSGGFDQRVDRAPLAEILRERGYATAAVVSQKHFTHETARDYARGFDDFDMQAADEIDRHGLSLRTADVVSDRALAWLEERPQNGPFFLWLHYFDPHDPYEPPEAHRLFQHGAASIRSGDRRADLMAERKSASEAWNTAGYIFSEADVAHLRDLYDGEIHFVDAQVGRVLSALERAGRVGNTIVVLTSDHGEWLGERGWWDHCMSLNDEEILVPFLMRVRGGRLGNAARIGTPISTLDFVPTVLGLLGAEKLDDTYHGVDLRNLEPERIALAMWEQFASARNRDWVLYDNRGQRAPRQLRGGVAVGEVAAEARAVALTRLDAALNTVGEVRSRVAEQWVTTIRELQAIGYVE